MIFTLDRTVDINDDKDDDDDRNHDEDDNIDTRTFYFYINKSLKKHFDKGYRNKNRMAHRYHMAINNRQCLFL